MTCRTALTTALEILTDPDQRHLPIGHRRLLRVRA